MVLLVPCDVGGTRKDETVLMTGKAHWLTIPAAGAEKPVSVGSSDSQIQLGRFHPKKMKLWRDFAKQPAGLCGLHGKVCVIESWTNKACSMVLLEL